MNLIKSIATVLVVALLTASIPLDIGFAQGKNSDGVELRAIDKIAKKYGVTAQFLQGELDNGYSLLDIEYGLEIAKLTKRSYKETANKIKPNPLNLSKTNQGKVVNHVPKEDVTANEQTVLVANTGSEPIEPPSIGNALNQAPYKVSLDDGNISTLSGNLTIAESDLTLLGRNGLDFTLTRTYDSQSAYLYDMEVKESLQQDYSYKVNFRKRTIQEALGYTVGWIVDESVEEDLDGDYKYDRRIGVVTDSSESSSDTTYYTNSTLDEGIRDADNKEYYQPAWNTTSLPYWRYYYYTRLGSAKSIPTSTTVEFGSSTYSTDSTQLYSTYDAADKMRMAIISNKGQVQSYGTWTNGSTYISTRSVSYYDDTSPSIEPVPAGTYTVYTNNTVQPYHEKIYPIGTGWKWNLSSIENRDGKKFVHLDDGGSYEVSGTSLKGYPWKDLTFSADASINVNGETSVSVLKSIKTGHKQYFNSDGRLIRVADAYGNWIDFHYTSQTPYGKVLTKVINSIGHAITISYSSSEVRITKGDQSVVYTKQVSADAENKELLMAVTDPAGRRTSYDYSIMSSKFNLVGTTPTTSNKMALVTGVMHPTGAKTVYRYQPGVTKRYIGSTAVKEVYRIDSTSEQITYDNGITEFKNPKSIRYDGDMASSYGMDYKFSVTMTSGGKTSVYDYKKDYIDSQFGDVYYQMNVTHSSGDLQSVNSYTYDEARRLQYPRTTTTQISKAGQLSEAITTSKTYDEYGNVLTSKNALGITTTNTYDPITHLLVQVDEPTNTTQSLRTNYSYNNFGTLTQLRMTDQTGKLLRQEIYEEFDAYGNSQLTRITDGTRETIYRSLYGDQYQHTFLTEQTTQVSDVDGVVSTVKQSFTYNPYTGKVLEYIDGNRKSTKYQYDAIDRLTKVVHPDRKEYSVLYDDQLNKVIITDETGVKTEQRWNPLGWQTEVGIFDKSGLYRAREKYGHDEYGRMTWSEDALGNRTEYSYDGWNRLTEQISPGGDKQVFAYNELTRENTVTDPDRNVSKSIFDKSGRLIQRSANTGTGNMEVTTFTYDYRNNVLESKNERNYVTHYEYDALGQVIAVTDAEGRQTKYAYDLRGRLIQTVFPDGQKVAKQYDELGRLIKKTNEKGQIEKLYYDANGNVTNRIDRSGHQFSFEYDDRNRLREKIGRNSTVSYDYDGAGRRLKMVDSTGTTLYQYTALGEMDTVTYPDGRTLNVVYDNNGLRDNMTDPFGQKIFYDTDNQNRLHSIRLGSETAPAEVVYSYTKNGRVQTEALANGTISTYAYEGMSLKSLDHKSTVGTVIQSYNYTYEAAGNVSSRSENGTTSSFSYDPLNRIDTSSLYNEDYSYDARGNRKTQESDRLPEMTNGEYSYDEWDQLVQVKKDTNVLVSYRYNGDGLLYERTENGTTTRYYYDGPQVIAEAIVTNNTTTLKARYIRGHGLVTREDSAGQKSYYTHNGHGDVTELRDASGALLNSYTYDIWGAPLATEEQVDNPFRYSGEFYDKTTSLQYLRARWYDPSNGRFLQEDSYQGTLSDPLTLNLYAYVSNNPLRYVDPTGHWKAGDEKLTEYAQEHIINLGYDWQDATSAAARKAIEEKADYIRYNEADWLAYEHDFVIEEFFWDYLPSGKKVKRILKLTKAGKILEKAGKVISDAWDDWFEDGVPDALLEGYGSTISTKVYLGMRRGQAVYVGITNNLPRRTQEHGSRFDKIVELTTVSSRRQGRAIEQAIINRNGDLENAINSISSKSPWYEDAVDWGGEQIENNDWAEEYGI